MLENNTRPSGSKQVFAQALVSSSGPIALVLLLPLMIIALGVPVVLAVRGLLELVLWLMANIG
jgi:hypothetical protein